MPSGTPTRTKQIEANAKTRRFWNSVRRLLSWLFRDFFTSFSSLATAPFERPSRARRSAAAWGSFTSAFARRISERISKKRKSFSRRL